MSTSPNGTSLIAAGTTIKGTVSSDSELYVDGVIRGDVAAPHLLITESGHIEGAIQAESVEARGHVVGSIMAKQVKLCAGCNVEGDVTHELLTIEAGADFQGRSLRARPPVPVLDTPIEDEASDIDAADEGQGASFETGLLDALSGFTGGDSGGVAGMMEHLAANGCAEHVAVWTSGQNLPVSPDQLSAALGGDQVEQMASAAGEPAEDFLKTLSDHLSNNGPAVASAAS